MEIEILQQQCGGTGFLARPHRLHLGAQNAEGVDQLHFILPDAWADCTLALYLRRRDGTQLAPLPLDTENCVAVDRRLTGSVGGQWMLAAVRGENYTAYTCPGSYEVYPTLPTDGGSEDLPPSLYEQFVARVLESARAAADSARKAETGAADTAIQAALAQKAVDQILADRVDAADCARRAEEAAQRAESAAPVDGQVVSVNGKGGAVRLNAQDVSAVPCPADPRPGELVRILSVDTDTGAVQTDTTSLPDLRPYVRKETVPAADTAGAVRADPAYGVAVRSDATLTTVPATKEQLDTMTEVYAPLTPALLPYGIKKALTSAAAAGEWSEQEKAAALLQLGADSHFYSKAEADLKFGAAYTLPPATQTTLGGIKVGANLTMSTDGVLSGAAPYTLTRDKIAAALGFTPAPSCLPCSIIYDHSYTGTGEAGSADSSVWIPLNGDYDAIAVIRTKTADYAKGSELARQRVLFELLTMEAAGDTFKSNYIALKRLPSTAFKAANSVNSGLIVMSGIWNNSAVYMQYKSRTLKMYWGGSGSKQPDQVWNASGYQYHVFGITLNNDVLEGGTA